MSAVVESPVSTPKTSQARRVVKFSIYRYNPDQDSQPTM